VFRDIFIAGLDASTLSANLTGYARELRRIWDRPQREQRHQQQPCSHGS